MEEIFKTKYEYYHIDVDNILIDNVHIIKYLVVYFTKQCMIYFLN